MGGQEIKTALGSNIKLLRAHRQFSQAILAEKANISIAYLSKIERGMKYPKPDILSQIAEGLGACRTCRILRQKPAKFYDLWAPYGVCKVKNAQKLCFFAFFYLKRTKPDKLLGVEVYVLFKTDFMHKPVPVVVSDDRKKLLNCLSEVMTIKVNNTMKKVFKNFEHDKISGTNFI